MTQLKPKYAGGPGKKIEDGGVGYSCIAEIRMIEKIQAGKKQTSFMRFGDQVGVEMNARQLHLRSNRECGQTVPRT